MRLLRACCSIPSTDGSSYQKLRRRGSFDFPVLSVAAAVKTADDGTVEDARIAIGAAASRPLVAADAVKSLIGRRLSEETIDEAASLASRMAKPLDNTDFDMSWRKRVTAEYVKNALARAMGRGVA